MPTRDATRGVVRRALEVVVRLVVGLQVAYLVLANLLLGTGLLAHLVSRSPETFTLAYQGAWSVWLGRVHVGKLSLHGSSDDLQWSVQAEHAVFDLHLRELFHRRVHASRVRGENMSFRLRLRLTPAEAERPEARALPPIEGFADPPLRDMRPHAEGDDDPSRLWMTYLDEVDVGVREIWIEHYRFLGDGRTRGGFRMRPEQVIEVMPSVLDMTSGAVTLGDHTLATRTAGRVDCTLLPFDPRDIKGLRVFDQVVAKVVVDAEVPGLGFLAFYLAPRTRVEVAEGRGMVQADVSIDRGRVLPGSMVVYETARVEVRAPHVDVAGEASLVLRAPGEPALALAVRVPHGTVTRRGASAMPAQVEDVRGELTLAELDLGQPNDRFAGTLAVPSATIPDLRLVVPAKLPADGPEIAGGSARLSAKLSMTPDQVVSGQVTSHVEQVALRWRDVTVRGNADGTLGVELGDLRRRRLVLKKSHVHFNETTIERKGEARPWWATVDVREAEISERRVGASVEARCKDGRPAVDFLEAGSVLPEWAGGLFDTENLTFSATIEHRASHLDFTLLRARGGSLDVRGRLKRPDHGKMEAAFLIKAGLLSVGIAVDDGTHLVPFAGEGWIDRRIAALGQ